MTPEQLSELIMAGEGQHVDFKEKLGNADQIAEHICAFANADGGGSLLFGVDDDGQITGIPQPDHTRNSLLNLCRNNVIPPLQPIIEVIDTADGTVLALTIIGQDRPYQTKRGRFLTRVSASKREMSREELLRLFIRGRAIYYDEVAVEKSSIANLDHEWAKQYIADHYGAELLDEMPLEQLLINLKLAHAEEDTELLLTVAGIMLFAKHPQDLLPYARISAVYFAGTEVNESEIVLSQEIEGRLDTMIEQANLFLTRNNFVTSEMDGWRRVDKPQYHRDALREAVVNAVAHRDYSITPSQIRIFAFADRVEIRSPGRLPNTMTIDNIRMGLHAARNPILYTHLAQMGYMKRVGIGVPTLVRLSKELSNREPHYELVGEELRLTIWARLPSKST